jgi:hypothetical protein
MGLARLPALGLSPSPFPPSPFIGVFLPSVRELLDGALAGFLILLPTRLLLLERPLRKRPVQKAFPCDDGFQCRRRAPWSFSKNEPTRGRAPKFPRPRGP